MYDAEQTTVHAEYTVWLAHLRESLKIEITHFSICTLLLSVFTMTVSLALLLAVCKNISRLFFQRLIFEIKERERERINKEREKRKKERKKEARKEFFTCLP